MKNKLKSNKGITLIALVITIIILIILAGISISMLMGENGLITKAKQARQNMQNATVEEQERLNALYSDFVNELVGTGTYDAIDSLAQFKRIIAQAITNAGVTTSENDDAETMADNIAQIIENYNNNNSNNINSSANVTKLFSYSDSQTNARNYSKQVSVPAGVMIISIKYNTQHNGNTPSVGFGINNYSIEKEYVYKTSDSRDYKYWCICKVNEPMTLTLYTNCNSYDARTTNYSMVVYNLNDDNTMINELSYSDSQSNASNYSRQVTVDQGLKLVIIKYNTEHNGSKPSIGFENYKHYTLFEDYYASSDSRTYLYICVCEVHEPMKLTLYTNCNSYSSRTTSYVMNVYGL